MKKYLSIFGAAILVMALAAPAMAQFKSWGHMEIQTIWEKTPNFNTQTSWANNTSGAGLSPGTEQNITWRHFHERFRFYLQYGDPKTVRAVIGFEADGTDWGASKSGSAPLGGGNMMVYTGDTVQLEIKHAYLDFMIPNTPVSITAGLQPFGYGGRFLINNDGPGVTISTDFAPHSINLAWVRFNNENRYTATNQDGYILDWKMAQKAFDVGAYVAYLNDLYTGRTAGAARSYDNKFYYIGASGGFRPGNWTFFLHALYSGGTQEYHQAAGLPSVSDSDMSAWVAEALIKYQIGPGMAALVEGFYATGNDADEADKIGYFPTAQSSEARSIFGNDRTVFFWMNAAQIGYWHNNQIDFSGLWYGRAAFEFSPTAWMRMILNYLYIRDTSTGTPGTYTNKATNASATKVVNSPRGSRQDKDEDFVGHEINLITTLNIHKGFVYNIGLYYFLPGEVFDTSSRDADASYGFNTKLVYAF